MKKNIILVVSIVINLLLITIISIYMFSPLLDMAIIQKSVPRFCDFVEKNDPVAYRDAVLCHIDERPVNQTQPTTPVSAMQKPIQSSPAVKNETTLGKIKLDLVENFKAIKSNYIVDSVGSQFTLISDNKLTSLSWAIVPNSFNGTDANLFPPSENISFATLLVKDLEDGDVLNNTPNINEILDLTNGEYPDGVITSYSLVKQEIIGKNASGDNVYEYDYIVSEASNNKLELQQVREFNGALWIHGNKAYILQDQTQISGWGESKINTTKSNLKDKISSMALSSGIGE